MSTAPKLAQRLANPGSFHVEQQQRLAQDTARKVNSYADMLNAMVNRGYVALAADVTLATSATYATLLTANITTVLAGGFLIITWSASGDQITSAGTVLLRVTVDGVLVKGCATTIPLTFSWNASQVLRVPVARGPHVVKLTWRTNVSSVRILAATAPESHAHMLVQEAA